MCNLGSGTRTDPVQMSHLLNLNEQSENEITAYICQLKVHTYYIKYF